MLDEGMHVRVVEVDGGLDLDEYCKQRGASAYVEKVNGAKNYFYWLADRARGKYDMRTAEGRMAGFQFLIPPLQPHFGKLVTPVVADDVARRSGVERAPILREFGQTASDHH